MKNGLFFFFCIFATTFCLQAQTSSKKEVLLSGNAYVTENRDGAKITDKGLQKWTDSKSRIETFVYFSKPQNIRITINGVLKDGDSKLTIKIGQTPQTIKLKTGEFNIPLRPVKISDEGYVAIALQGISKTGNEFGEIKSFTIENDDDKMVYVHDFADYWARRGPSVHFSYTMPKDTVEWFYNEVTVPENNDVIGSYYMANGFGEGYFGMQCNSEKERRVLFSVWSPFETQDPKLIPDSMKVVMLDKGEDVYSGEFGNEGSGGQSFLRYPWKATNTYHFLTRITPDNNGNTVYTAWFFASEENRWRLIASFLRPKTDTYYKRAHSFLENFIPEQGYISRKVFFGNQWFRTKSGKWISATEATFTYDATARAGVRIDYQGGYDSEADRFFLKNDGFFHESTEYMTKFHRTESNNPPKIDFEMLP